MKMDQWDRTRKASRAKSTQSLTSVRGNRQDCNDETETLSISGGEEFGCSNIDFESLVGIDELEIDRSGSFTDGSPSLSDIWGWEGPNGEEIIIQCMNNGVRFLDISDPTQPINLGFLPSNRLEAPWCDVKVYQNVAYIVKDQFSGVEDGKGIQIFDLMRLIDTNVYNNAPVSFTSDNVYTGHGNSHNVAINTESGFLYSVGTNKCGGGLHIIDVKTDPLNPTNVACSGADGYVHDAQCVNYDGPDTRFVGDEICFGFNEDSLTIYNVTDKNSISLVGKAFYATSSYTHQGWVTPDMKYLLLDDELDELFERTGPNPNTRLYIFDIQDLEQPKFSLFYDHPAKSIDHNLYIWGHIHAKGWGGTNQSVANPPSDAYAYCSNYDSGVRVVNIKGIENQSLSEAGYFDVVLDTGTPQYEFTGAWSTYMTPSGTLAVSSIDRGMFILTPRMAFNESFYSNRGTVGVTLSDPKPIIEPSDPYVFIIAGTILAGLALLVAISVLLNRFRKPSSESIETKLGQNIK
eukprot:CAMPEP_0204869808 /NCGR_PEP_ID=MMETSP1348-20121228/30882_1 /ASSEMBLY_ACC=CAM_ASM_000700 /TAXON_ID=215587 /ORGANISM="Aplanochytrium stocchinoi, Strain GSBS06" /LENGTH=518 /DNA_ID=CAMNT_0052023331 /DNA_START=175 /DNA_END=1731 /DNA_ORIENTATION=+